MNIKLVACLSVCSLLSSCDLNTSQYKPTVHDIEKVKKDMFYFQDSLGLCYAGVSYKTYGGLLNITITNIPCANGNSKELKTNGETRI